MLDYIVVNYYSLRQLPIDMYLVQLIEHPILRIQIILFVYFLLKNTQRVNKQKKLDL